MHFGVVERAHYTHSTPLPLDACMRRARAMKTGFLSPLVNVNQFVPQPVGLHVDLAALTLH